MAKYQKLEIRKEIASASPSPGFELNEKQLRYLKTAGQVALAITIGSGVVALSVIAPNIFTALDEIFGEKQHGSRKSTLAKRQEELAKSFYYMRQQGYIEMKKVGGLLHVYPTKKGRKRLSRLNLDTIRVAAPGSWRKTWWIVLADIPSKPFRSQAYLFQKKLKQMGFYPLQRTAWVYPFDPRREVEVIAAHYKISPFVTAWEARTIDPSDEALLLDHFKEEKVILT